MHKRQFKDITCEGFWKSIFILHTFRTAGAWFLVADIFLYTFRTAGADI